MDNPAWLLILLLPALALAGPDSVNPCGNVRLDAEGQSMEHVTPISQTEEDTGTCYAFTSSEIFDAWRFSHGPRLEQAEYLRRASPIAIAALASAEDHNRKTTGNGRPSTALKSMAVNGACEHSALFNGTFSKAKDLGVAESALISRLEKTYRDFETGFNDHPYFPVFEGIHSDPIMDRLMLEHANPAFHAEVLQARRRIAEQSAVVFSCKLTTDPALFGEAWATNLGVLNTAISSSLYDAEDPVAFVGNLVKRLCSGHMLTLSKPAPESVYKVLVSAADSKAAMELLHSRLNQPNPQPMIVNICSKFLTEGHPGDPLKSALNRTVDIDGVSHVGCRDDKDSRHAVVIMGRRLNPATQRCELLIQNSWGGKCSGYGKSSWECESTGGRVWIEDREVFSNAIEVDYLQ